MERWRTAQFPLGHLGAALRRHGLDARGATLVELLVSTLFLSILMGMSYTFARAALMSARVQEVKSEAQEVTVMALDILTRELRMAGCGTAAKPVAAVRAAAAERVEVASDLNGDGDTADSNEIIAYSYDVTKQSLMRATGGGSPQPLVRNIARNGLRFSYFDASGAEIVAGPAGMATGDRGRVRRIDVILHVEIPNPDPWAVAPLTSNVAGSITLRNP